MNGIGPAPQGDPPPGLLPARPLPPGPPADAVSRAKADFLDGLGRSVPALRPAGARLLTRIATPNWALEWGLSHWMADSYGLRADVAQDLLLSNVSLLAFARVLDDLADGEAEGPPAQTAVLASALQHLWTRRYVGMFEGVRREHFWSYFDESAARWLRALRPCPGEEPVPEADRGALLHIACAAGCLAADREDALAPLVRALDHLLDAVVLLDDAFDWEGDLAAGRRNALVSFCSPSAPPRTGAARVADRTADRVADRTADRVADRAAVLRGVYAQDVLPAYFAAARESLRSASDWCRRAGCPGLGSFVTWYDGEVDTCSQWMRARACRQVLAWARTRQGPAV